MIRIAWIFLTAALVLTGKEPARPKISGLAHAAFYARDPEKSSEYYRQFLGFELAYKLDATRTEPAAWVFKINDRQFVEIYPEREANSDRLHHIAIETPDAAAMRD